MANNQDITNSYLSVGSVKPVGTSLQVSPIATVSTKKKEQTTTDVGLADYNDPKQINSIADIIMNAQIKKQRYGGPDNIYLSNLLNTIPATIDYVKDYIVKPISSGRLDYLGLNLLTNLQETADIVANPTKGFLMGLADGTSIQNVLAANGYDEAGRKNFDWDTGSIVTDIIAETLSDPLNYVSFGAKAAASTAVKGAAKSIASELGEETAEKIIKKAAKGFVTGKAGYETLESGIEQANKKLGHNVLSRWFGTNTSALSKDTVQKVAERASKEVNHTILNTIGKTYKALDLIDNVIAKASLSFLPGVVLGFPIKKGISAYQKARYAKVDRLYKSASRKYTSETVPIQAIEKILKKADAEDLTEEAQQITMSVLYNDISEVYQILNSKDKAETKIVNLANYVTQKHNMPLSMYRTKVVEIAKASGWHSVANSLETVFHNLDKQVDVDLMRKDMIQQFQDDYIRKALDTQKTHTQTPTAIFTEYDNAIKDLNKAIAYPNQAWRRSLKAEVPTAKDIDNTLKLLEREGLITKVNSEALDYANKLRFLKVNEVTQNLPLLEAVSPVLNILDELEGSVPKQARLKQIMKDLSEADQKDVLASIRALKQLSAVKKVYYSLLNDTTELSLSEVPASIRADLLDVLSHSNYTSKTVSELRDDPNFVPEIIEKLDVTRITKAEEDLNRLQVTNKLEQLMQEKGLFNPEVDYSDVGVRVEALEQLYKLQDEPHELPIFLDVQTNNAGKVVKFAYKTPNSPLQIVEKATPEETVLELMQVTEYAALREGVSKKNGTFVTFGLYQSRMQEFKQQAYQYIDSLIYKAQEKYLTVDKFNIVANPPHDVQLFNREVAPLKKLRARAKYGFGKYQQPFELNKVFNPNTIDKNIKSQIAVWLEKQLASAEYSDRGEYKWLEVPSFDDVYSFSRVFDDGSDALQTIRKAYAEYAQIADSNREMFYKVSGYKLSSDRQAYAKMLQLQNDRKVIPLSTQSVTNPEAVQRFVKVTKATAPEIIAESAQVASKAFKLSQDWLQQAPELLQEFVDKAQDEYGTGYFLELLETTKKRLGLSVLYAENDVDAYVLLRYIDKVYDRAIPDALVNEVTHHLTKQSILLNSKNIVDSGYVPEYIPIELKSKDMNLVYTEEAIARNHTLEPDLTDGLQELGYILEEHAMSNKKAFELHSLLRPLLDVTNQYNKIYDTHDTQVLADLLKRRRLFNDDLQVQVFEQVAKRSPKDFLSFLVHDAMGRVTFSLDDMTNDRMLQAWQVLRNNVPELEKLGVKVQYEGPRVYISLSNKWTPEALREVPRVAMPDLNFSVAYNYFKEANANVIAEYIRTMEAFTKEADSLSIRNSLGDLGDMDYYKKLDNKIPESIRKETLSSSTVMQAFPDRKFSFGYSNLGLTASVRDLDSFYASDILKRYAKTAQTMARAAETKIQLREVFFDESFSLKDSLLFKEFTDNEILEALRRSPQYTLCTLVKNAKGVEEVIKFDPRYITNLDKARSLNPVLIPTTFYNQLQSAINKFELPEGPLVLWNKLLYLFKVGYLCSTGAIERNMTEGIYKNMMESGEVGDMARAYYKANELFNLYEKTYRDIIMVDEVPVAKMKDLPDTARMTDDKVAKYFASDKATLTKEEFFKLHEVIGNLGIGMSKELQDYFFRNGTKETGLWSTIVGWTSKMLSPHSKVEQLNRLALYLVKKNQGFADIEIFDRIGRAHIDMASKTKVDHIMSLIFPFYTFTTKNMAYYMDLLNKNHFLYRLLTDIMTPILDLDDRSFEELKYNRSLSYQILAGNVVFENNVVFKINPSFMDVFNNLATPTKATTDKLAAPITLPFELAAEDADVAKLLVENIPMVGTFIQRANSAQKYMQSTNNNPLNLIPTLFGAVKRYDKSKTKGNTFTGFGRQSTYKLRIAGLNGALDMRSKSFNRHNRGYNGSYNRSYNGGYSRRYYAPKRYGYKPYKNYRRYTPNLYKQLYTNKGRSRAEFLYRNSDQRLAQNFRIRYRIQYTRNFFKYN